ncbi:hypothetical protein ES703_85524 [subsurface metagenome]
MQLLKCAGCAGVATGSVLVYAYILMYYTKDRGFKNHGFFSGGFRGGGYLKAEGEGVLGAAPFSIEIRTISPIISIKCAGFLILTPACGCAGAHPGGRRELWL